MGKSCEQCGQRRGLWERIVGVSRELCSECTDANATRLAAHQAKVKEYKNRIDGMIDDKILTQDEETELKMLSEQFDMRLEDFPDLQFQVERVRALTRISSGMLPVIPAPPILLKKNEICHGELPVALHEIRTRTVYVGGYQSVSFRIAKGVRYTVGGFRGEPISKEEFKAVDEGTLFNRFGNAIQFQKENDAKPKWFVNEDSLVIEEISLLTSLVTKAI
jgi:hypothetical protein